MVCDSITKNFFRAPGPRIKYFERYLFVVQKIYKIKFLIKVKKEYYYTSPGQDVKGIQVVCHLITKIFWTLFLWFNRETVYKKTYQKTLLHALHVIGSISKKKYIFKYKRRIQKLYFWIVMHCIIIVKKSQLCNCICTYKKSIRN